MILKHKFKLEKVVDGCKTVLALQIHRCNQVGSPDEWQQYILDLDELDDLRRLLDVGMGDCDHCEDAGIMRAWRESLKDKKPDIISHDMKRLSERMDDLTRTQNQLVHKVAKDYCLGGTPCEFVKGVAEQGDIATAGLHALAKCIDDLKVELERWKTDVAVMKFAFTTHMGVSHEQDKQDETHCSGSGCGKKRGVRPRT